LNSELKKERQEKNKLAAQLEEANKELESRKRRIQTTNGTSPIGRKPFVRPSFGFDGGFSFDDDSENKENDDSDIQVWI